jgi:hypothetical protein
MSSPPSWRVSYFWPVSWTFSNAKTHTHAARKSLYAHRASLPRSMIRDKLFT